MLAIVKTMKSPRSAVLKTSIMACTDIFNSFGNLLSSVSDDAFDKLVHPLASPTGNSNGTLGFVCSCSAAAEFMSGCSCSNSC